MDLPFKIIRPTGRTVPILLSVPHCGIEFPPELTDQYIPSKMAAPDDTDWFVQDLYDFVSDLGITMIHARYSRWVIDLNRDPDSKPLYDDGRIITALTPTTDFFGDSIYRSYGHQPDRAEVDRRLEKYYWPYYKAVGGLLADLKTEHGAVLLWDGHSIRRSVPTIQPEPFPDMILGDVEGRSASGTLIKTALETLQEGPYEVNHNHPFKGGHITRYFGKPDTGIHALQLEMNKVLYMDDAELQFAPDRAGRVRKLLKQTLSNLVAALKQ